MGLLLSLPRLFLLEVGPLPGVRESPRQRAEPRRCRDLGQWQHRRVQGDEQAKRASLRRAMARLLGLERAPSLLCRPPFLFHHGTNIHCARTLLATRSPGDSRFHEYQHRALSIHLPRGKEDQELRAQVPRPPSQTLSFESRPLKFRDSSFSFTPEREGQTCNPGMESALAAEREHGSLSWLQGPALSPPLPPSISFHLRSTCSERQVVFTRGPPPRTGLGLWALQD